MVKRCTPVLLLWAACAATAHAEAPAAFCARVGTDDTLRPIPASLAPAVNKAFGTALPAGLATQMTVFRCDRHAVLVCSTGANLPCGKADTSRTTAGGAQWCRTHPDAPAIPASATGHATLYAWRCRDGEPVITGQPFTADRRGFVAEFWRRLASRR